MEDGNGALFGGKTSGELERTQVSELGSVLNLVCLCDWCEISQFSCLQVHSTQPVHLCMYVALK